MNHAGASTGQSTAPSKPDGRTDRRTPIKPGAETGPRATPQHWLLCHMGLYKFEFEFAHSSLDRHLSFVVFFSCLLLPVRLLALSH